MASQRPPGRPVSAERFGRERIISGFRALVRDGRVQITRKDIAEYLGVTPALVTYYFPESNSLLVAAMSGIFDQWLSKIHGATAIVSQNSAESLIDVIVSFFRVEVHTEELFRTLVNSGVITDKTLRQMEEVTTSKISEICQYSENQSIVLSNVIWGVARQFAVSGLAESPTNLVGRLFNTPL